ncbi:MAG TPA: methylated-DNA--[protein]-cysteine S-methyltransferase [Acidimicrobiales bacterium]|nr:methylated-DNA--[protein]-cysteine S-methyltransferase [Acidimicrobiales bacterium]
MGAGVTEAATATISSPCGPFTVLVDEGAVVASGWTAEPAELVAWLAPGRRPHTWAAGDDAGAGEAAAAYFAGRLDAIDDVAVSQRSGPFVQQAWAALRTARPGAPLSYRQLAAAAGRPGAARAAGLACATNAVALFVPCHRAVRGDGSLGGFRWGLAVKRWLLAHEAGTAGLDR